MPPRVSSYDPPLAEKGYYEVSSVSEPERRKGIRSGFSFTFLQRDDFHLVALVPLALSSPASCAHLSSLRTLAPLFPGRKNVRHAQKAGLRHPKES